MALFEEGLESFAEITGKTGTGMLQGLGMAFGLPSCLLNMAAGALNLLPSSTLAGMQSELSHLCLTLPGRELITTNRKRVSILLGY